uniref:Secreted protein n=1 Tax=Macrostomum lignano TaxID=282301 RepID=A0A1I8I8V9_9PLAT
MATRWQKFKLCSCRPARWQSQFQWNWTTCRGCCCFARAVQNLRSVLCASLSSTRLPVPAG